MTAQAQYIKVPERLKVDKSDPFRPLYTTKKRYTILTGGRGSLKSTSVHKFIACLTYQTGHGVLFTRYTMSSAEISIIPEFRKITDRLGITNDFNFTKTKVTNKLTGSFIYFSGIKSSQGDQTGRLKSISGITTWVIEEGEDFNDPTAFRIIDDSIRSTEAQNRVIWIQNPTTKEHFIYQKFIKDTNRKIDVHGYDVTVSDHKSVEHIHTTYRRAEKMGYLDKGWCINKNDSKKIAAKAIREAAKHDKLITKHSSHYYYNYVGGWLERAEGVIYTNWKEGKFRKLALSCHGLDYGFSPDPLGCVEVSIDPKKKLIYVREKIYALELSNEQIDSAFKKNGMKKYGLIIVDNNESRTTFALKKKYKWNVKKTIKWDGSVVDGIREIHGYTIIVDPESVNLKNELNNHTWNDKKSSIPNKDGFHHLLDAMRYAVQRLTGLVSSKSGAKRKN